MNVVPAREVLREDDWLDALKGPDSARGGHLHARQA